MTGRAIVFTMVKKLYLLLLLLLSFAFAQEPQEVAEALFHDYEITKVPCLDGIEDFSFFASLSNQN